MLSAVTFLTGVEDPAGALCPIGFGRADQHRPVPRHVPGEGFDSSDTYSVRVLVKGTGPATAERTWNIIGATGQLAGLHGGGDYRALIDPFPIVTNTYTGFVHTKSELP